MRYIYYFLLLLTSSLLAQKPLDLKIDSIIWDDSEPGSRKFTVSYTLKNLTDQSLQFFLNPKGVTPNTAGSMTNMPYYKIYENDTFIEIGNAFRTTDTDFATEQIGQHLPTQEERDAALVKYFKDTYNIDLYEAQAEMQKEGYGSEVYQARIKRKKILHDVFTIEPKEAQSFEQVFYWNKDRYYILHDVEYYLDENVDYFFEMTIVLHQYDFGQDGETNEEQIVDDSNFIQGVFISNKMPIYFGK